MTCELLFVTSSKVTAEVRFRSLPSALQELMLEQLVRELQLADGEYPVASPFSPARQGSPAYTKRNKAVPDVGFDLFEHYTDAQPRPIVAERAKTDRGIHGSTFLILDERGVETKTVVVRSYEAVFDEETAEITEWRWFTWRVAFEDVQDMLGVMENKTELFVLICSKPEPL